MRILIDTHILIWHLEDDVRLSNEYGDIVSNPRNDIFISTASLWKMAIKSSLGKLKISRSVEDIVREINRSTSTILAIEPEHIIRVSQLPFHHKDPFDRLIVAQALNEGLPIITSDTSFSNYGVDLL